MCLLDFSLGKTESLDSSYALELVSFFWCFQAFTFRSCYSNHESSVSSFRLEVCLVSQGILLEWMVYLSRRSINSNVACVRYLFQSDIPLGSRSLRSPFVLTDQNDIHLDVLWIVRSYIVLRNASSEYHSDHRSSGASAGFTSLFPRVISTRRYHRNEVSDEFYFYIFTYLTDEILYSVLGTES